MDELKEPPGRAHNQYDFKLSGTWIPATSKLLNDLPSVAHFTLVTLVK